MISIDIKKIPLKYILNVNVDVSDLEYNFYKIIKYLDDSCNLENPVKKTGIYNKVFKNFLSKEKYEQIIDEMNKKEWIKLSSEHIILYKHNWVKQI